MFVRLQKHGNGIAFESAQAALKYGFDSLYLNMIVGTCHEENLGSRRVLEKCGMKFVVKYIYNNENICDWLGMNKAEWKNLQTSGRVGR